ncbi:hypothetical protein GIW15_27355, partial [Pseudomonas lurida]|nr:hypothetical protein [Pseudomonas lurida]
MSILNIFFGGAEELSYGTKYPDLEESILQMEKDRGIEYIGYYIYKPMKASALTQ